MRRDLLLHFGLDLRNINVMTASMTASCNKWNLGLYLFTDDPGYMYPEMLRDLFFQNVAQESFNFLDPFFLDCLVSVPTDGTKIKRRAVNH